MSFRRLYLTEDPKAKKAMANIVKRGIDASPAADKQWGDALLQAVDTFDVEVRSAASGGKGKSAPAKGDKKAPAKAGGSSKDKGFDPKVATRTSKPGAAPAAEPDDDLDDDWFLEDEPELGPPGPGTPPPKRAKGKTEPATIEPDSDDDFPSFPGSQAFQAANAPKIDKGVGSDDDDDFLPTFNPRNFGSGTSSWDEVPDWMRDPDFHMPGIKGSGRDSMPIPRTGPHQDDAPATNRTGPSPVGKPWTDADLTPQADKKQGGKGLLGRMFGRKGKK